MGTRTPSGGIGSNQYASKGAPQPKASPSDRSAIVSSVVDDGLSHLPPPLPDLTLQPMNSPVAQFLPRDPDEPGGERDSYDFDAPYQRGSVWSDEQRRNLIKSLIMKLPIGATIISKLPYDRQKVFRVLDGKQRLLTIRAFVNDEFAVPGHWFHARDLADESDRAGEVRFSQLSDGGKFRFTMRPIATIEFDPKTEVVRADDDSGWIRTDRSEEEMLQAEAELYLLINFGGVAQTDGDMDRAAAVAQNPSAHLP